MSPLIARASRNLLAARVHSIAAPRASLDHLVGAREQHRRHLQAERISGLEVDGEFKFCRLLDWQIGWHGPLENLVHKVGRAPTQFDKIHPIGRQSARRCEFQEATRGKFLPCGKGGNCWALPMSTWSS